MASMSSSNIPASISTAEDIKVLLRDRLPQGQRAGSGVQKTYIRGAADFQRQYQQYLSLSFRPAAFAGDFPENDEALAQLANGLSNAMLDMEGAVEAGQKSVTRINQLSPYEVELKSWEFLFILRDVQLGQVALPSWGKLWPGEDFDCFMDRYNDAVIKLQVSKSIVSSLFDQDFSVRLALAPASELKKKIANMNNNARRAVELAMVRTMKDIETKRGSESKDSMNSGSQALNSGGATARMVTQGPSGSKRQRTLDYIAVGGQKPGEGQQFKRARPESSFTISNQINQGQAYTEVGHDRMSTFGDDERDSADTFGSADLFDTPTMSSSSQFTERPRSNGQIPGLIGQSNIIGHTARNPDKSNTDNSLGPDMDFDATVFKRDEGVGSPSDTLALNTDWSYDLPKDAFKVEIDQDNDWESEAPTFDQAQDYNLANDASNVDIVQDYDWESEALTFDPAQDFELPDDAFKVEWDQNYDWESEAPNVDQAQDSGLLNDAAAFDAEENYNWDSEGLDLEALDDFDPNSASTQFDESQLLADALLLEPLLEYNLNGASAVFDGAQT